MPRRWPLREAHGRISRETWPGPGRAPRAQRGTLAAREGTRRAVRRKALPGRLGRSSRAPAKRWEWPWQSFSERAAAVRYYSAYGVTHWEGTAQAARTLES